MLANFAELVMRILESEQHQTAPSSIPEANKRHRLVTSPAEQVYALVDTTEADWKILYGSKDFLRLCDYSREAYSQFWSVFQVSCCNNEFATCLKEILGPRTI